MSSKLQEWNLQSNMNPSESEQREIASNINKYKNPPLTDPHENPDPWDHAQMIERKILCRIALTRAPETQTRP